jgi:hypothetical protein
MSTKTTFKRIALVAVASLGFGMLSVVPSTAADVSLSVVDSLSASAPTSARVGAQAYIDVTLVDTGSGIVSGTDTATITAKFVTGGVPAGSTAAAGTLKIDVNASPNTIERSAANGTANVETTAVTLTRGINTYITGCASALTGCTTANIKGLVSFQPDVAGSYQVIVWAERSGGTSGTLDAGEKSSVVTVTTGTAPASLTLTKVSAGTPTTALTAPTGGVTSGFNIGSIWSVVAKDSNGKAVYLTNDETLALSATTTTTTFAKMSAQTTAVTGLVNTDARPDGSFMITVNNSATATESPVITVSGGGAFASSVSVSATAAFVTATAADVSARSFGTTGTADGLLTWLANDTGVKISAGNTASIKYTVDAATVIEALSVTDTFGQVTGYHGAAYTQTATAAASIASFTAPAVAANFSVVVAPYDNDTVYSQTLTGTAPTATTTTISPASLRAATGSTLSFTGATVDQFGVALAGATVAWSVTGTNTVASTNKVSDADGITTFSYTLGTTAGTDTVAATNATSRTVTSVADLGVSTVLLVTPHTTSLGVTEAVATYSDINAGASGASGTTIAATATVKDAAGNLLVGVPVTFTVSGTGAAVTSTTMTVYTGSAGTAAADVYGWVAGTYTVTATAGGKSDDAPVNFGQITETEARNIKATVSGSLVTAKVTDRYGNGVYNVAVYATRTGAGTFAGVSKANGTTDRNGEVEFVVSGGDADVTVSVGTTVDYGQTDALAGLVASTTATDIFTASVAGTATTAEVGVGATFSAAGNNSAKVTVTVADTAQAAADASAEATDAANAATDAANAAAEAADAATAAAQDAADAVAALSTQVSEMVNALKKQITALTNLVIKIQKKVKA